MIDILVTLVIIAQLTAILFPAFSRVRDSARRVSCAGNLKQIGLAVALYAADNDGHYPNKTNDPDINCAWADRLLTYTKSTAIFVCPSSQKLSYFPGCPATSTTERDEFQEYLQYDGSYDLNLKSTSTVIFPLEATFTHPSETISILDGNGRCISSSDNDMGLLSGADSAGLDPARHFGGYNILFLDGHVKWMKQENILVPTLWKFDG